MLPLPKHHFGRRLGQLLPGLMCFGFGIALMVRADLGLSPWQVFHQGVAHNVGMEIGPVVILTGIVVLLVWIPLRERFGLGTILNVALIGNIVTVTLRLLPEDFGSLPARSAAMSAGIAQLKLSGRPLVGCGRSSCLACNA